MRASNILLSLSSPLLLCPSCLPSPLLSSTPQGIHTVHQGDWPTHAGGGSSPLPLSPHLSSLLYTHRECIQFIKETGLPTLVVGGGGYVIRNVSRCWTYETSLMVDETLSNDLPYNGESYTPSPLLFSVDESLLLLLQLALCGCIALLCRTSHSNSSCALWMSHAPDV